MNYDSVGTASLILKGTGRYTGTKVVRFKITGIPLKDAVTVTAGNATYLKNPYTVMVKPKAGYEGIREGTDYEIIYGSFDKAGTVTVTVKGLGNYTGSIVKKVKVLPFDLTGSPDVTVKTGSAVYEKGGVRPAVSVTLHFGGEDILLQEGIHHSLKYSGNTAAGTGTVTVAGRGNFKGSLSPVSFDIAKKDLMDVKVSASDKVSGRKMFSPVVLRDVNGRKLKAGTDYNKVKDADYTYVSDTYVANGKNIVLRHAGESVNAKDIAPEGTLIRVTVTAKGNNYTGSTSAVYRILKKNTDISKAKVKFINNDKVAKKLTKTYTGKALTLEAGDLQVIVNKETLVPDVDYEIISYAENISKGTASAVIRGKGKYGGTKTVRFTIGARKVSIWDLISWAVQ